MGCSASNETLNKLKAYRMKYEEISNYLWIEYVDKCKHNELIKTEMSKKEIKINDTIIQFDYVIKGDRPNSGFPLFILLHQGKIGLRSENNIEYLKMKKRYFSSIKTGIILTIKGSTDLSNMHHSNEALHFYDHIIKNMICYCEADSNKVYLLGMGLGGNSVYQIASRYADKFAAICIISGHSYGNSLKNLIGLPMLIQTGEMDFAYDRNKEAVKVYQKIKDYSATFGINSECKCYIHTGKNLNIIDNKKDNKPQSIIKYPTEWLINKNEENEMKNTNSISFLSSHVRNPLPKKVIWDITKSGISQVKENEIILPYKKTSTLLTKKDKESVNESGAGTTASLFKSGEQGPRSQSFYWLETGNRKQEEIGSFEIIAQYDKDQNLIFLEGQVKYIIFLLNDEMVNFSKEVKFKYKNEEKSLFLMRNSSTEKRTLYERGDIHFIFQAAVEFKRVDSGNFTVEQIDEA